MRQRDVVSDADAVRRVLGGYRDDFAILVHRYLPAMEALAYSATGSRQDAEDIAQESFLRAFRHLDHLREPKCFGSWLGRIVKNTAQSFLRRRRPATPVSHPEAQQAPPTPTVEQREIHAYLRREIGRLDEMYRDVLLLHYFSGISTGDIANVLNISRSAVLKRLERGRQALGERLVDALGQGLQTEGRHFDEKACRAIGLVASVNAPWMAAGKAAASSTLAQKLLSAVAQHKAAALGVALLATTCAVFLAKAWPASASGVVQEVQLLSAAEGATTAQTVVEPASTPVPVAAQTAAEPPVPALSSEILTDGHPADRESRREAPAGYPGQDSAAARRHVVEGIVLDPYGQPLPGAQVWAARYGFGVPDTRETLSDQQGRFMLKLPDGRWKVLAAKGTLGGEASAGPGGAFVVEGMPATVRMTVPTEERSVLHGQLLDKETGKPVGHGSIFADNNRLIPVDEEGGFVLEGLRREDHTFLALCPGYQRQYVLYSTALRQDTMLEVALNRGAKLAGTITDQQGRPAAGAWVSLLEPSVGCTNGYYEVCDDQGRFEYEGAPLDREFRIEAMWPCYINGCGVPMPGATQWKGAVTASKTGLNLVLPEGPVQEIRPASSTPVKPASAVIHGRVLGPDGRPVRTFYIRPQLPRPPAPGQIGCEIHYSDPGVLFTSEDGAFALTSNAKPGEVVRVVASVEGFRDAVIEKTTFKSIASSHSSDTISLRVGQPVSVTVLVGKANQTQGPVEGARVTLAEPYWDVKRDGLQLDQVEYIHNRPRHARTDARGRAVFPDVPWVDGVVRVERDGYAVNGAGWDGRAPSVTVMLEPECILQGEVMAEDGTGPTRGEGLVVLKGSLDGSFDLYEEGAVFREHCIFPEHRGKFRIAGLPPRRYTLDLSWQDGEATQAGYLGGSPEQPVVVTSKAGGDVPGAVERGKRRQYSDTFVLDAGQTLEVSYPRDDVRLNPDRVAAQEAEVSADAALHQSLIGVWERFWIDPNGAQVRDVLYFGEDGALWTGYFGSSVPALNRPGYVTVWSGSFSVLGGDVHFYDERGHYSWYAPVEAQASQIRAGSFTYTRNAQGLEDAIQKAQNVCGVSLETDLIPLSEFVGLPSL